MFGFYGEQLPRVDEGTNIETIINTLQENKIDAALVTRVRENNQSADSDPQTRVVGMLTLEDVFEGLLQVPTASSALCLPLSLIFCSSLSL